MTTQVYFGYLIFFCVLAFLIGRELSRWRHSRRIKSRRRLISERLVKIMHNPFTDAWTWTRLNPKTRTWEWQREATPQELNTYGGDVILSEEDGDKILTDNIGVHVHEENNNNG